MIIDVKDDLPVVGQIKEIYVVDNSNIIFSVQQFSTLYEEHYRAYVFQDDGVSRIIPLTKLFIYNPVHIHKSRTLDNFIILPHALCTL